MSHALEHAAIVVAGFVTLAMVALLAVAVGAHRRERRRFTLWIALAFGVFAVKSLGLALALAFHVGRHELVELAASLLDLAVAGLLLAPFLLKP